ncbi:MAG TPA: GatB/YqeY domain-containing protein [Candidatus Paceibacterota bacterium]|nr:GatB/YqeY domain-containing protein [Candidatus Paceibacterota bacterium]
MNLLEKINSQIKEAMKEGNSFKVGTLRMVVSSIKNREIEKRAKSSDPLTEEEIMEVLRREVKKRRESIEIYGSAGRGDLKEKEELELKVIQSYLPAELTKEEVEHIVAEAMAGGEKEFGKIMKAVKEVIGGRADGKLVSEIIKKHLEA